MNCTECNGPLGRIGSRILKKHTTCPPIGKRTWPTAYKPSDLESLRKLWKSLLPRKRATIREIFNPDPVWCHCPKDDRAPEYYHNNSGHGWVCGTCGKLIQVG